jgi:AcrR family transcriptional regulator
MPLIVDRDARRSEVARIAARLIAQGGFDAASIREIARTAGYSTAVVSYYFRDKRELMLFTYREAMAETVARARRRRDRGGSVSHCLEALLPLDRRMRDNWKIWFAFWGMAMADPEFMAHQQRSGREARMLIAELLETAEGAVQQSAEQRDSHARRLLVTIAGLATQATYDPVDWSSKRQRTILAAEISSSVF